MPFARTGCKPEALFFQNSSCDFREKGSGQLDSPTLREELVARSERGCLWSAMTDYVLAKTVRHYPRFAGYNQNHSRACQSPSMISLLCKLHSFVPGGNWIAERWFRPDEKDPNAYLYQEHVVRWMHKPATKRQLPLLLRLFASYSAVACCRGHIFGGQVVFRSIGRLSEIFGQKTAVRLDLGDHILYVNLKDPRMLKVPRELLQGEIVTELGTHLKAGDTFVDIGSNHGSFSIAASQLVGRSGRVIAVEAQPHLASLVRRSLEANNRAPFEVHAIACGDREGTIEFFISEGSSGSSGVFAAYSAASQHRKLTVPLKCFDQAIAWRDWPGNVFLKLDIEGSELVFLGGASEMIRARQPLILMEVNPGSMQAAGFTGAQMLAKLTSLGYAHFIEAGSTMKPAPLAELYQGHQHNVILIPQTVRGPAAQAVA